MNTLYLMRGVIIIPAFIFSLITLAHGEHPDSSIAFIRERTVYFDNAAQVLDISPACLKAIVYVERTLNYDWKDDALDVILANVGKNSSIGFCQVKLKTAYWIERTMSDTLNAFNPGYKYGPILAVSKNPVEIINKLKNDSLNILYAASYMRIIQSFWKKAGFTIDDRPDIIGTLYSTGLFSRNGLVRKPNAKPKPNFFGLRVKKILYMF